MGSTSGGYAASIELGDRSDELVEAIADDEAVDAARPGRSAASARCRRGCRRRRGCDQSGRARQRRRRVRLVADEAEVDEHVRETMVRQQIDRPVVAARVIRSRRSHAVLRREHAGRDRGPDRIRAASAGSSPGPSTRRSRASRAKFGSRPSATRGQTYSSDAPSSSSMTTRGPATAGWRRAARASARRRIRGDRRPARGERQRERRERPRSRTARRRRGCRAGRTNSARPRCTSRTIARIAVVATAPAVMRRAAMLVSAAEARAR